MRFIYTKTFAIFAGCLVLLAALIIMQLKGWLDPLRAAALNSPRPVIALITKVTYPVKVFFTTAYQLKNIARENGQLRSEAISLKQELVQYEQEKRENQALRNELGFATNTKLPLASCSVLSENPFGLTDSLVLNCGTNAGISEGQAVISQGYLVGKIVYTSANSSSVLLVTSSNFSADATVSKTAVNAIVKGSFGSGLILDQVPQTAELQKGWLVVTAGINQKIPKNILIGEVSDTLSSSSDLFKRTSILSPIDFNNLEFVFVVKQ